MSIRKTKGFNDYKSLLETGDIVILSNGQYKMYGDHTKVAGSGGFISYNDITRINEYDETLKHKFRNDLNIIRIYRTHNLIIFRIYKEQELVRLTEDYQNECKIIDIR